MTEVQNFYDRHPYPPPSESLDDYQRLWRDPQRRRAEFHLFWPERSYREQISVLIAGCGTSQAAKHALRRPAANITGVDLSATSVNHTQKLKRKYRLDNLCVHQLSIERAAELHATFDLIVCTGVLHHLADPEQGLRVLRGLLKPDGVIHLMVYAPYGRAGIYLLQDFCRRAGVQATKAGIRDLIAALAVLPQDHPLTVPLREAPDFRDQAALADALLHPQDRAYSVPQLFELLGGAGLTFCRWLRQAPYSPLCGVMSVIPQSAQLAQLPLDEQYAAAELFRGTMLRHSVVARRVECAGSARRISFADEAFLQYVPIRLPDTVCIPRRPPSPTAAVLINRAHGYSDLVLPINAREQQLYEAIDGERTIAEIAGSSRGLDVERAYFERLLWMDQIVVDASRAIATNH
jgi:SAM-dependent methyltransferase